MSTSSVSTPKNILLATDLGPRTDRALDRAFHLAKEWDAELTVAHAIEFDAHYRHAPSWKQGANRIDTLKQRTGDYFKQEGYPLPDILIGEERPDSFILNIAGKKKTDLIITGIARSSPFGFGTLGSTVGSLVRKAGCPVLTVKKRVPRQNYRHIAVATDMSSYAEKALHYTLNAFPNAHKITAIHAAHAPLRGFADQPDHYARSVRDEAYTTYKNYLSGLSLDDKVKLVVDEGPVGCLLANYVDDMDVDLVVTGTHGAGNFLESLLGSSALDILEAVSCDVLVVR